MLRQGVWRHEPVVTRLTIGTAALTAAAAVGAVSAISFYAAAATMAVVAAAAALTFLSQSLRLPSILLVAAAIVLGGYAFAGRGFAYVGAGSIFVGELLLLLAALLLLVKLQHSRLTPIQILLVGFMLWGFFRTVPYVQRDGINAFRDAVVWAYALLALTISLVVTRDHFKLIADWYGRIGAIFVCWVPVLFILSNYFGSHLPTLGNNVHIPYFQADATAVHLAAIAGFVVLGLYERHRKPALGIAIALTALWFADVIISASASRGAILGLAAALGTAFLLRPTRVWLIAIVAAAGVSLLLLLINPTLNLRNTDARDTVRDREVSVTQLVSNTTSIIGVTSEEPELGGTRRWRLEWWNDIIDYTVRGSYFWTGKGFGVNLADEDGFQVEEDRSLRSPHNTHLTILARMGVPGFTLWIALNALFVFGLWRRRVLALERNDRFHAGFLGWLLVYWMAMTVAGMFSLYLESPHRGIWFWAIFGIGLAELSRKPHPYHKEVSTAAVQRLGARRADAGRRDAPEAPRTRQGPVPRPEAPAEL